MKTAGSAGSALLSPSDWAPALALVQADTCTALHLWLQRFLQSSVCPCFSVTQYASVSYYRLKRSVKHKIKQGAAVPVALDTCFSAHIWAPSPVSEFLGRTAQ